MSTLIVICASCLCLAVPGVTFALGFLMGIAAAMDVCAPPVPVHPMPESGVTKLSPTREGAAESREQQDCYFGGGKVTL